MYIELSDLLLVSLVLAGCAFWWSSLKHRDLALKSARQSCDKMGLQLLDQSVGLQKLRFKRDDDGQVRLFRRYGFEFSSTGDERYHGEIDLLGKRVTRVFQEPHRM